MNIAILGGGVEGWLAALSCHRPRGHRVTLYDAPQETDDLLQEIIVSDLSGVSDLFRDLGIDPVSKNVAWGVYHSSDPFMYTPARLQRDFPSVSFIDEAQTLHYRKTRGHDGLIDRECMGGVWDSSKVYVRTGVHNCDVVERIQHRLVHPRFHRRTDAVVSVHGCGVDRVGVQCADHYAEYDRVITTIPLDVVRASGMIPGMIYPRARHRVACLNAIYVHPSYRGQKSERCTLRMEDLDFVYTPWLDVIHKVSWWDNRSLLRVECNGDFTSKEFRSSILHDMTMMFGGLYLIRSCNVGLRGHIIPLPPDASVTYPVNVVPFGAGAEWSPVASWDFLWTRALDLSHR